MNILVTMAALAFTFGIGGVEAWTVQDPAIGFEHVPHEIQVVQPAQCLTAAIEWVDGSPKLANSLDRVRSGGLEPGEIRLAMVGPFIWVAVGYPGNQPPDSIDMVVWSVEVFPGDEVFTVCLP